MYRYVLGCALAAGVAASGSANAQDSVKIGLVEPLTGSVAYNGKSVKEGAKLAVEQINAKGCVLGKPVELVI